MKLSSYPEMEKTTPSRPYLRKTCCCYSLYGVDKTNADVTSCPSACFIFETTERISISYCYWEGGGGGVVYINFFLGAFNFGSYKFDITSTLHETQMKIYD